MHEPEKVRLLTLEKRQAFEHSVSRIFMTVPENLFYWTTANGNMWSSSPVQEGPIILRGMPGSPAIHSNKMQWHKGARQDPQRTRLPACEPPKSTAEDPDPQRAILPQSSKTSTKLQNSALILRHSSPEVLAYYGSYKEIIDTLYYEMICFRDNHKSVQLVQ
jgi:hypothetical protein